MTYLRLKSLIKGMLVGDNVIPQEEDTVIALVETALLTTATKADSLHLMTLSTTADVLRLAQGDYLIRMPVPPTLDTDLIDIDEELTPAVARYVASYISAKKGGIHIQAAERIILDYNAKTWEIFEQMEVEAAEDGVTDMCYTVPSTEFTL